MDSQDSENPPGESASAFLGTRQDQILGPMTNAAVARDEIASDVSQPLAYDPNDQAVSQPAALSLFFTDLWYPYSPSNVSRQSLEVDNIHDPFRAEDFFNAGVDPTTIAGTWNTVTSNGTVQEVPLYHTNVANDVNQHHWIFADLPALDLSQYSPRFITTLSIPEPILYGNLQIDHAIANNPSLYPPLEKSPLFSHTPSLDASRLASDSLTLSDGIAAYQTQYERAPLSCAAGDSLPLSQVPAVEVEMGSHETQREVEERALTHVKTPPHVITMDASPAKASPLSASAPYPHQDEPPVTALRHAPRKTTRTRGRASRCLFCYIKGRRVSIDSVLTTSYRANQFNSAMAKSHASNVPALGFPFVAFNLGWSNNHCLQNVSMIMRL